MPYEPSEKKLPEGFVNLGEKLEATDLPMPITESKNEYHYPSLYFDNVEGLADFPKEGTATIYFKKVMERKEVSTRDGETKKRHTVELCIYGIKAGESEDSCPCESEDEMDDEDAIENGLSESEKPKSK